MSSSTLEDTRIERARNDGVGSAQDCCTEKGPGEAAGTKDIVGGGIGYSYYSPRIMQQTN